MRWRRPRPRRQSAPGRFRMSGGFRPGPHRPTEAPPAGHRAAWARGLLGEPEQARIRRGLPVDFRGRDQGPRLYLFLVGTERDRVDLGETLDAQELDALAQRL